MRPALLALLACVALPAFAQNSQPEAPVPVPEQAVPRDTPYPGTIALEVDATNTAQGIFRIKQTIPVAAPGTLTLRYPQWLPGNHAPTGPIGAMAGLRIRAGGQPVAWKRNPTDMYAFDVAVPAGANAIEVAFDFLSPTGGAPGRTVMTPDMLNLQWEKAALYPAGHFTRAIRIQPTVTLPAGWTGVSALDGEPRQGRIQYPVTDFETMVDSPMFAGRHFKVWNLGHGVDLNTVADRPEDLAATDEQIAAHRRMVDQMIKLFGARHYDRYDFLFALSDEMGRIGLEHHRSSENAVPRNYFTDWENTGSVRGLLPHEFEHSWNGKYRRPADLWTPDYDVPMQNSLLWVYEGQTSFWDYVIAARSGLIPKDVALGEIASNAAYYSTQAGRQWRPLADTTNQPIIAYGTSQSFPSLQRGADYYSEGALIWLDADQLIREKTRSRRSMDDFARAFFGGGRAGDWGTVTYTFDDVVATLNDVVAHDWASFLNTRIDRVSEAPLDGIRRGGYRLVWKEEPNAFDASSMKSGKRLDLAHSLGISVDKDKKIGGVAWDGPMFRQGVTAGATIVAVNGREYSDDELKSAIKAAKGGTTPIQLLLKEGTRYRTIALPYYDGLRWPHLEKTMKGTAPLDRMLAAK